ncbi:putative linear gramicidin synthase subunit D [Xylogone sp. PMI_703]|nr:putative linear gramicidin synthase subunit D [Xylogone sp. PMI_703]
MKSHIDRKNSHQIKLGLSGSQKQDALVNVLDFIAKETPQLLYAEIPVSETSYMPGYRKVNYEQLANAVNGAARYLHDALGPGEDFETLAYIGPNDLRYNIFILGAIKAGYKAANHVFTLCNAFANQSAWIYPISGAIPSAQLLAEGLRHTDVDAAFVTPSMVVELSKNPDLLKFVGSKINMILCSGGSVPTDCGNRVVKSVNLFLNVYGSSEQGSLPQLQHISSSLNEWEYIHFHPDIGASFCHIEEDLYEPRIINLQAGCQPVFKLYPDVPVFNTGDLFSPHPTKSDLWIYRGRLDDIIVFSTGEKTNPIAMENHIATHPGVKSALVVGHQRFQAALIVELQESMTTQGFEKAEIIERIWPIVEEANRDCPKHAKISKSHILLAFSAKPFARAGKGTVQRRLTMKRYADELDALYADAEGSPKFVTNNSISRQTCDPQLLGTLICSSIEEITEWKMLNHDTNFFINGMDSLQTLNLTRKLREITSMPDIIPSIVYSNPSVTQLTKAILGLSDQNRASFGVMLEDKKQEINDLLAEYQVLIDRFANLKIVKDSIPDGETAAVTISGERVVILTGTTGALGSHLLEVLLQDSSVHHIYCLNRASDSLELQKKRNKIRKLSMDFSNNQVTFLTTDLAQPSFGLESQIYDDLLRRTTDIILNAWPVNFNIPLAAFREQLSGICNVINFCSNAHQAPSILFVSSISAVLSYNSSPVPETIIFDPTAPAPMGYGKSKYIAERLLNYAAKNLHVPAKIARVGQISGPAHRGSGWNRSEWLPSLVVTSSSIGVIPDCLGSLQQKIDWIPVDFLANVLVELAFKSAAQFAAGKITAEDDGECGAAVFHVMNPYATTWDALLPTIIRTLETANSGKGVVEIVSFEKWLQKLKEAADISITDVESPIEANPAVKLVDAYETLLLTEAPEFAMDRAMRASMRLQDVVAMDPDWIEGWCREWLCLHEVQTA